MIGKPFEDIPLNPWPDQKLCLGIDELFVGTLGVDAQSMGLRHKSW